MDEDFHIYAFEAFFDVVRNTVLLLILLLCELSKSVPTAPKTSKATVDAKMTDRSRHLGTLMKAPESSGTAAPREKQIIDESAACM